MTRNNRIVNIIGSIIVVNSMDDKGTSSIPSGVGIMGTSLNRIYLKAVSGTQKVYVLAGGS